MHWVLLRGLAREAGHWGGFVERLRAAFPDARVSTPDLPGSGALRGVAAPTSIPATLDAVRAQLQAPGHCHLLALSLGGMVAYEWALRAPGEVAGVVFVSSSLGRVSAPWHRLRPGAVPALLAAAVARGAERERRIFALTSARPALADATVAAWTALARLRPPSVATPGRQLLAAARYRPAALAGRLRALVLASEGDRLVDPVCSRALARVLDAPLRVHRSAGHDLPLDEPDWVVTELRAWLSS